MWLVAMSRCVVRVVVSCDEVEDELVIRTTKYCECYTVLPGTTTISGTETQNWNVEPSAENMIRSHET